MTFLLAPRDADYVFNSPSETGVSYAEVLAKHVPLKNVENARPLVGTNEPGYSPVYRNCATDQLKRRFMPHLDTYYAFWKNSVESFPAQPALASRPYDYKTGQSEARYVSELYAEVDAKCKNLGSGLLYLLRNNRFKNPDCEAHRKIDTHYDDTASHNETNHSFVLTIYLGNRAEWVLTDLACVSYSITNTVLYDTLGPSASEYILHLTQSPVVMASYKNVQIVLELKKNHPDLLAALICVVSMDPLDCVSAEEGYAMRHAAQEAGLELYDLAQVCGVGALFPSVEIPPKPETVYTISFTSGTTGSAPKGVVLTQENAALAVTFVLCMAPPIENDLELAFLPLAHIFQRQVLAFNLAKGGMTGFPQMNGTPLTLFDDLRSLKPKHMANVPRVYTKLEAALKKSTLESNLLLKRSLFTKIINEKTRLQSIADGNPGSHWFYDKVFLSKVRALTGFENMQFCITGLAPISPLTQKFLKAALNIGFSQGYGLTELFAGMCFGTPYEKEPGGCGSPGVCSDIRVHELPELGYTLDNPDGPMGELEIRGLQNFHHYFKNGEETKKLIHNGWFRTGDVARIHRANGCLYIVDRVKNFFKLSQGEYVTPEKIENAYLSANSVLTQCFVHGESVHDFLVAVIGVDPEKIVSYLAQKCNVASSELQLEKDILAAANRKENRQQLLAALNKNVTGLAGFEMIHNVYVEFEPLRLDRDVITPTVKIRRPIAAKFFAEQIHAMYDEATLISKM
ncbi:acetyl-CoA synthetase-like protein [Metschnikowia bicuspidata]|uniref:Acetyl-CoA synthetase-like protein n=1 Tax=Metschnikowia bicuspidata TaxID=27322 RepID=A0A4P9ZCQ1_9ASCO|nr:acetyl-CoA synthetase-like protein [Metschnikowia bicuspidata]